MRGFGSTLSCAENACAKSGSQGHANMAIGDLPIFEMMKQKMHWLAARQQVLSQNVANADTPGYTARDLKELDFGAMVKRAGPMLKPAATQAAHIGSPVAGAGHGLHAGQAKGGEVIKKPDFETSPTGNSVVLEDQMIKVAETQMDYQTVTGLYSKSLGLIKIALGRS
jgi:flagellar basal-body rod protein FlgB